MAVSVRCIRHLVAKLAIGRGSATQLAASQQDRLSGLGIDGSAWAPFGMRLAAAALRPQGGENLRGLSTLDSGCLQTSVVQNGAVERTEAALFHVDHAKFDSAALQQAAEIGYSVVGRFDGSQLRIQRQRAFAVVQVGSHQFKVTPGDLIYTEKLKFANINDKLALEKVLLVGTTTKTVIGRPTVPDTVVHAAVEEHALDAKVIIFKKKRRKNYRRTTGHRQELTALRILKIQGLDEANATGPIEMVARPGPL